MTIDEFILNMAWGKISISPRIAHLTRHTLLALKAEFNLTDDEAIKRLLHTLEREVEFSEEWA